MTREHMAALFIAFGVAMFMLAVYLAFCAILKQQVSIMSKLDDILTNVRNEKTLIGSISATITGLQQAVKDATAASLSPADQQKIDDIFAGTQANIAALTAATVANTPAATVSTGAVSVDAPAAGTSENSQNAGGSGSSAPPAM